MNIKEWVGVGFLGVLILFLMIAYFHKAQGENQYVILRVLTAMSAGMAGLLLTGTVAATISGKTSEGFGISVDAAGAIGLAVIFWFTFPRPDEPSGLMSTTPEVTVSFPAATQFYQAAVAIGRFENYIVELEGFTDAQKAAPLRILEVRAPSVKVALAELGALVAAGAVPDYRVEKTAFGFALIA